MKFKHYRRNLGLIFLSMLLGVLIFELILIKIGRYSDQVNGVFNSSNKIWTRFPNTLEIYKHHDLNFPIEILFDENGARKSLFDQKNKKSIAVFGDSFTENRGLLNEFTFTEILNKTQKEYHFHNFGVNGYGLEQSFQHWLDKQQLISIDKVIYVFCSNDIKNTYEVNLFDRNMLHNNEILNIVDTDIPFYIHFASNLHITYLLLETYYKIKNLWWNNPSVLARQLFQKFTKNDKVHGLRFNDQYASTIEKDVLSQKPKDQTIELMHHFQTVLKVWNQSLVNKDIDFHILILPRVLDIELAKVLMPKNLKILQLKKNHEIEVLKNTNFKFENDGHWNEYGNLAAAMTINSYFNQINYDNDEYKIIISEINDLYQK